jgi:hypothetical protein
MGSGLPRGRAQAPGRAGRPLTWSRATWSAVNWEDRPSWWRGVWVLHHLRDAPAPHRPLPRQTHRISAARSAAGDRGAQRAPRRRGRHHARGARHGHPAVPRAARRVAPGAGQCTRASSPRGSLGQGPPGARRVIRFFVAGFPKSMKVGGVARFVRAGKVHMVPRRGNTEWATLVGHVGREYAPPIPLDGHSSSRRGSTCRSRRSPSAPRPDVDGRRLGQPSATAH